MPVRSGGSVTLEIGPGASSVVSDFRPYTRDETRHY